MTKENKSLPRYIEIEFVIITSYNCYSYHQYLGPNFEIAPALLFSFTLISCLAFFCFRACQAVEATKNVEQGNKELSQAIQRNSSSRTFLLLFLFVLTFSILFLDWYSWSKRTWYPSLYSSLSVEMARGLHIWKMKHPDLFLAAALTSYCEI